MHDFREHHLGRFGGPVSNLNRNLLTGVLDDAVGRELEVRT